MVGMICRRRKATETGADGVQAGRPGETQANLHIYTTNTTFRRVPYTTGLSLSQKNGVGDLGENFFGAACAFALLRSIVLPSVLVFWLSCSWTGEGVGWERGVGRENGQDRGYGNEEDEEELPACMDLYIDQR